MAKVPMNYVKAHCIECECGKLRYSCWIDKVRMITMRPCKRCDSIGVSTVMQFTPKEYKIRENSGRVFVRLG